MTFIVHSDTHVPTPYAPFLISLTSRHLLGADNRIFDDVFFVLLLDVPSCGCFLMYFFGLLLSCIKIFCGCLLQALLVTELLVLIGCDHDDYAYAGYSTANMTFIVRSVARVPSTYTPLLASLASRHLLGADNRRIRL